MSQDQDLNEALVNVKKEEPEFDSDAFLSLLRDDQILMGGFDLDQAIAETEGTSRPASGDGAVGATDEELQMRLEMDDEEPVSDAEGDDNEDEDDVWPPRDPSGKKASSSSAARSVEELTRRMMARVERMGRRAEEQARGREAVAVTTSRLKQGMSFNVQDWTSEELKELYDGVKKSGTSKQSLVRMLNNSHYMSKKRSIQDVYDKIADLRAMNREHRATAIRQHKVDSHARGTLKFQELGQLAFVWSQQLQKLQNSRTFSRRYEYVRDQLTKFFTARVRGQKREVSIDGVVGGKPRPIRWTRLYRIVRFTFSSSVRIRTLPARIGINAMEAAVLMLIMNDIQKQARATLTERMKAEHGTMFLALARQEYNMFNLDTPVTNYAQPFLDPLRVGEWRGVATEEAPEAVETYDQVFHGDDAPQLKAPKSKKRVRIQDGVEDLMEGLDVKRTFVDDLLRDE